MYIRSRRRALSQPLVHAWRVWVNIIAIRCKGTLHTFKNVGSTPARFLTLLVPAGLENYFEEVGKPGTDFSSPPLVEQEDIDRLLAAAPKYGVEIKPPLEP